MSEGENLSKVGKYLEQSNWIFNHQAQNTIPLDSLHFKSQMPFPESSSAYSNIATKNMFLTSLVQ